MFAGGNYFMNVTQASFRVAESCEELRTILLPRSEIRPTKMLKPDFEAVGEDSAEH